MQDMQKKQQELFAPISDKAKAAIEKVARVNRSHGFGAKKGAKRDPLGDHFGSQNLYKIASKFECDSGDDFGCSWAPPEAKKQCFQ